MGWKGTVALSAIDANPASGSALDGCRNPVFHVSTEHFSTRIWMLVLRIGRRGINATVPDTMNSGWTRPPD